MSDEWAKAISALGPTAGAVVTAAIFAYLLWRCFIVIDKGYTELFDRLEVITKEKGEIVKDNTLAMMDNVKATMDNTEVGHRLEAAVERLAATVEQMANFKDHG